jgi:2-methylcitrate dehydratase PrpD
MTLTETFASHVANFKSRELGAPVAAATRRLVLDTVAVAWAGANAPGGKAVRDLVVADGGATEAMTWAWGDRLPAASAAFVNGVSAAALDYDSVYEAGSVHADAVVVPAAWAAAERAGAGGMDFLAAVALGTDIACRLGKAARKSSGWFYTSLTGVFGAAAACARLAGHGPDAIAKTMAKRLQSAFAARAGVFCAQLAGAGATGPRAALEGPFGYFAKYEDCDPKVLLDGLGEVFENTRSAIKKYPSCTANHAPIDAAIALARELDIDAAAVDAVEVTLSPFSAGLVGGPFEPAANPQVSAQFSIQYSLAAALLRRRLAIADIQDSAVLDPAAGALAEKVRVIVDQGNRGKFAPSKVAIVTRSHGRIEREAPFVPGAPDHPLTSREIEAKVADCVAAGPRPLSPDAARRLIARVENIAEVTNMARFFDGVLDGRSA